MVRVRIVGREARSEQGGARARAAERGGQARELRFAERDWEAHVAAGDVPPEALVFSLQLTGGLWRPARELPLYDFFRRSGEEERREATLPRRRFPAFADLPRIAVPRRGLSVTELLVGANLLVAVALVIAWRGNYTTRIWDVAWSFHQLLLRDRNPVGLVATIFMHADLRHLGANLLALLPASAFVEYLYGRRVGWVYLLGGLAGGVASYAFKGHGPMSVGASGAVYALYGACGGYLLRHLGRFPRWERWRARRIYIPLLLFATLPSILHADWRAHVAGFLGGVILGLVLAPHARGRDLLLPD